VGACAATTGVSIAPAITGAVITEVTIRNNAAMARAGEPHILTEILDMTCSYILTQSCMRLTVRKRYKETRMQPDYNTNLAERELVRWQEANMTSFNSYNCMIDERGPLSEDIGLSL
jgi:hypothetical protein